MVPMYDWASFFAPIFRKLPEIKVTHHFHVMSSKPGVVATKKHSDSVGKEHNILKEDEMRLQRLYPRVCHFSGSGTSDKIREFCPVADQDITCPEPSAPRPDSRQPSGPSSPSSPSHPPPAKRPRRCMWTVWPTWSQQEELYSGLFTLLPARHLCYPHTHTLTE